MGSKQSKAQSNEAVLEFDADFIKEPTVPRLLICVAKNLRLTGEELKTLPEELKHVPHPLKEKISEVIHLFGNVERKTDTLCTKVLKMYIALEGALDAIKYAERAKEKGDTDSLLHFAQMFESSLNSLPELSWTDFAPILGDLESLGAQVDTLHLIVEKDEKAKIDLSRVWKFLGLTRGNLALLSISIDLAAQSCGISASVTAESVPVVPTVLTTLTSTGYWRTNTTCTVVVSASTVRARCSEIESLAKSSATFSTTQSLIVALKQRKVPGSEQTSVENSSFTGEERKSANEEQIQHLTALLAPEFKDKIAASVAEVARLRAANDQLRAATREYLDLFSREFVRGFLE